MNLSQIPQSTVSQLWPEVLAEHSRDSRLLLARLGSLLLSSGYSWCGSALSLLLAGRYVGQGGMASKPLACERN